MVKCGVLFEVRTGFLNIIPTSFGFKGLKLISNTQTFCQNTESHDGGFEDEYLLGCYAL
jgi:hypothetical protein